jgi:hypothetical protein
VRPRTEHNTTARISEVEVVNGVRRLYVQTKMAQLAIKRTMLSELSNELYQELEPRLGENPPQRQTRC